MCCSVYVLAVAVAGLLKAHCLVAVVAVLRLAEEGSIEGVGHTVLIQMFDAMNDVKRRDPV